MTVSAPFQGNRGGNSVVSPGIASASITVGLGNKSLRFVNAGANICHVRVGEGAQVATTADTPVLPNSSLVVSKSQDSDTVAHISAAGTTLHIQPGEGGF